MCILNKKQNRTSRRKSPVVIKCRTVLGRRGWGCIIIWIIFWLFHKSMQSDVCVGTTAGHWNLKSLQVTCFLIKWSLNSAAQTKPAPLTLTLCRERIAEGNRAAVCEPLIPPSYVITEVMCLFCCWLICWLKNQQRLSVSTAFSLANVLCFTYWLIDSAERGPIRSSLYPSSPQTACHMHCI